MLSFLGELGDGYVQIEYINMMAIYIYSKVHNDVKYMKYLPPLIGKATPLRH
jgi:hypothetical protein